MSSALVAYVVLARLFLTSGGRGWPIGRTRKRSLKSSWSVSGVEGVSESLVLVSLSVARPRLSPLLRGPELIEADANFVRDAEGGRL